MEKEIKLLISPNTIEEAITVIRSNVNYIDCKNPNEGSLGANFPWIINKMKKLIPPNSSQLLSATIGDFPYLPGSASLAALGATISGADIIKVGLKGPKNEKEGIDLMEKVVKAIKEYNPEILVVAAGYADQKRINTSPHFLEIPTIASKSGCDIAMLDTCIKDGTCLFDFLDEKELITFVNKARKFNLQVALAGNLRKNHLDKIKSIAPDIIGIRTAVCEGYDRNRGQIKSELIEEFKNELYK
ncbi:MAG: (5-formylfuran-3-yl)methyl phosphate synthase [Promethearchaeota archaeon]